MPRKSLSLKRSHNRNFIFYVFINGFYKLREKSQNTDVKKNYAKFIKSKKMTLIANRKKAEEK